MNTSTKRVRASKLKPEQRKQLLLSTAIDVFVTKGIGSVKHADVAKAAGVAPPTVFSYFPSREQLTTEVLDEVGRFIVNMVVDIAPDEGNLQTRLYKSALHTIKIASEKPNYIRAWLMFGVHFNPEVEKQYKQYDTQVINKLSDIIKAGSNGNDSSENIHDRARIILGSSAYLQKMILEGVSEERQQAFIKHIVSFASV